MVVFEKELHVIKQNLYGTREMICKTAILIRQYSILVFQICYNLTSQLLCLRNSNLQRPELDPVDGLNSEWSPRLVSEKMFQS